MRQDYLKTVHVIALGFCALCAQAIFIREMLSLFAGTELGIGTLFAGWLFWIGIGGIFGARLGAGRWSYGGFIVLSVCAALLVPITTVGIRLGRASLVEVPGTLPPFFEALLFCLAVMAPFGFVYGTVYNAASSLWRRGESGLAGGVSRVYIREALGSLAGAFVFSFLLVRYLPQLEAAFAVALFVIAVLVLSGRRAGRFYRCIAFFAVVAAACIVSAPVLERKSIGLVFSGYEVVAYRSSRYGEIVVASHGGDRSFFSSGGRLFSVPEPERAEETVHLPLLMHPAPARVLLIGGSLGGGWEEAMKHPSIEKIDCVELDGELLGVALALGGMPTDTSEQYAAPPVRFILGDGRFFVTETEEHYDIVIVSAPPPVNLQWNRYYTEEFFRAVKRVLAPGGVFACSHPSSENFLSRGQARVIAALELTLRQVFPSVQVLPGSTAHCIASDGALDPADILPRLQSRGIETRYVSADFLPYRLSPERIEFLAESTADIQDLELNTDTKPVLPLYELVLEGERTGSRTMRLFANLLGTHPAVPPLVLGTFVLILALAAHGGRAARLGVWIVGFGGFLLQLLIMLAYQSFSGHLYLAIVMLSAFFMGGLSLGAQVSYRRREGGAGFLRLVHLGYIILSAALIGWLALLRSIDVSHLPVTAVFICFSAGGGILTGSYYPVVVRTALPEDGVPATFYAWDLFGACVGGLVGGLLLFPLSGVVGTVLVLVFLHAVSAVFVAGRW